MHYSIYLPGDAIAPFTNNEDGEFLEIIQANSKEEALKIFLEKVDNKRHWYHVSDGTIPLVKVIPLENTKLKDIKNVLNFHQSEGYNNIYIDLASRTCPLTVGRTQTALGPFTYVAEAKMYKNKFI